MRLAVESGTRCVVIAVCLVACGTSEAAESKNCELVESGTGPTGNTTLQVTTVASGLEVPWSLAFLDSADTFLVSERPGRVRLVERGDLVTEPVLTLQAQALGEGGLLGIALLPDDPSRFVAYYSSPSDNRVERFVLSGDKRHATSEGVILSGIAKARFHDGGRVRFGPDKKLYVGTGDATLPERAQDPKSKNGKVLRLDADGTGSATFVSGVRNVEGIAWRADGTMVIADHGPSGELGRSGHDELSLATQGDNLGWPTIFGCQKKSGMVSPLISWEQAVPPGGVAVMTQGAWKENIVIASLGAKELHRVVIDGGKVSRHESYLKGAYGRLREAIIGPDGALYVTTSNCDGRGDCPAGKDRVLRITPP